MTDANDGYTFGTTPDTMAPEPGRTEQATQNTVKLSENYQEMEPSAETKADAPDISTFPDPDAPKDEAAQEAQPVVAPEMDSDAQKAQPNTDDDQAEAKDGDDTEESAKDDAWTPTLPEGRDLDPGLLSWTQEQLGDSFMEKLKSDDPAVAKQAVADVGFRFMDMMAMKQAEDTHARLTADAKAAREHPEYGGEKFEATQQRGNAMFAALFETTPANDSPEAKAKAEAETEAYTRFAQVLADTGAGVHPDVVLVISRLSERLQLQEGDLTLPLGRPVAPERKHGVEGLAQHYSEMPQGN